MKAKAMLGLLYVLLFSHVRYFVVGTMYIHALSKAE